MGGCAAPNCSNHFRKGYRLFRFPRDPVRRKQWLINCRRGEWEPKTTSYLCEVHFEENQYEANRLDGWKKLRPDAVPTLFNIPFEPKLMNPLSRKSVNKNSIGGNNSSLIGFSTSSTKSKTSLSLNTVGSYCSCVPCIEHQNSGSESSLTSTCQSKMLEEKLRLMVLERNFLKTQLEEKNKALLTFLNEEQVAALSKQKNKWGSETIIKALKMRFALSVHGYEYLRQTNYPLPSYKTLMRRLSDLTLEFGLFHELFEPLKHKLQSVDVEDRYCMLSFDEMQIQCQLCHDKNRTRNFGHVTLGNINNLGKKLLVFLIRGLKNQWKQVVACHITDESTDAQLKENFIRETIQFVENAGAYVLVVGSNMDPDNQCIWTCFQVHIEENGMRNNKALVNEHDVFVMPDICHLLKNLKSLMLQDEINLPTEFIEQEQLPTRTVNGEYIVKLWNAEIGAKKELRSLHHLTRDDIYPDEHKKMNVGSAARFYSLKTASAIERAVELKLLHESALTTAKYITLVADWFSLVYSKLRKTCITSCNKEKKYSIIQKMIDITQKTEFGAVGCGWKPLNVGIIMASVSIIDIAETLFLNNYQYLFTHRLSQDAIENVFSQVRQKASLIPTALQCLDCIKGITVSQYISDVKRSNFFSHNDIFLVDFLAEKHDNVDQPIKHQNQLLQISTLPEEKFENQSYDIINFEIFDLNMLFYIGSSTTIAAKKNSCSACNSFLSRSIPETSELHTSEFYTMTSRGDLTEQCEEVILLIINCEFYYQKLRNYVLHNSYRSLIEKLVDDIDLSFPICCNIKYKIVEHFFCVRNYAVAEFSLHSKKRKKMRSTAFNKKQKIHN